MRYTSGQAFLDDPGKCVAVIGLSGAGKTTASRALPSAEWFHYSVDYRIWTHYLGDQLNDFIKSLALNEPTLRELLLKDAITVEHRVEFDNLFATSVFMGMLGDPAHGGSTRSDFDDRMAQHAAAEKAAMSDILRFRTRAQDLYGYAHLVVDTSGSLCEIVEIDDSSDATLKLLEDNCLVLYIEATDSLTRELVRRNHDNPKPIYYRPDFLNQELPELLSRYRVKKIEDLDPATVGRYLYPKILEHRIPRYKYIADKIGYKIGMMELLNGLRSKSLEKILAGLIDDTAGKT